MKPKTKTKEHFKYLVVHLGIVHIMLHCVARLRLIEYIYIYYRIIGDCLVRYKKNERWYCSPGSTAPKYLKP